MSTLVGLDFIGFCWEKTEVDPYNLDSLLALGVSCTNELDQLPALLGSSEIQKLPESKWKRWRMGLNYIGLGV